MRLATINTQYPDALRKTQSVLFFISLLLIAFVLPSPIVAQQPAYLSEPENTGLSLHIDNDLFVSSDLDRDYTGGIALTLSGKRAVNSAFSIDNVRTKLDTLTRFTDLYDRHTHFKLHAIEFGFVLFTPSAINIVEPQPEDHPYASLFFLVNSQQVIVPHRKLAFNSVFTIGALGLDIAEDVQSGIHQLTGSSPPKGWSNQISAGGELTARYSLGVQKSVLELALPYNIKSEFKLVAEGNIGFTTDVGVGFNARIGRIHTPWWAFNPHQAEYVSLGSPTATHHSDPNSKDLFLYLGVNLRKRFYNAVLQGQFRDSAVTYDAEDLNANNIEVWAGISYEFTRNWNIGGFVRTRTAELKRADSNPIWGGFTLSRSI